MELLDIEQTLSQKFYTAYLNNTRSLILLFDRIIYKEHFIMLPGDEVSEKKHKNVKHLIAMERNEDLSRRETRKFPGLGQPIFKIDFAKMSPAYVEEPPASSQDVTAEKVVENEVNTEVSVQNTAHHKAIIKARNEFYNKFKKRFETSTEHVMSKFDNERIAEMRFNDYWAGNLKEITVKHI